MLPNESLDRFLDDFLDGSKTDEKIEVKKERTRRQSGATVSFGYGPLTAAWLKNQRIESFQSGLGQRF